MRIGNASDPDGTRTRVAAVKGRCPRPLDDGAIRNGRRLDAETPRTELSATCRAEVAGLEKSRDESFSEEGILARAAIRQVGRKRKRGMADTDGFEAACESEGRARGSVRRALVAASAGRWTSILGGRISRRLGFLLSDFATLDGLIHLSAMNRNFLRRLNAQADLVPTDFDHHDGYVVVDDDALVLLSGQNQHGAIPLQCVLPQIIRAIEDL